MILSLTVSYYFLTREYALGSRSGPSNFTTFTTASAAQNFRIEQIDEAWKGRLAGLLLAGSLVDQVTDKDTNLVGMQPYADVFALYHAGWLFLLFLVLTVALRNSLFVILGIFAALMYNFSPAAGMRAFPWDIPATLFFTLAVLCFERRRIFPMLAIIVMGFFFKETVLLCAILLLFNRSWKWSRNLLTFGAVVVFCLVGKRCLLWGLHLDTATLAMGESNSLGGLVTNAWRILRLNFDQIFSWQLNHVVFVNGGTLLAVLWLDWRTPRFWPYKLLILLFVGGQLLYGLINEFRIFMEVLPLSWILLIHCWERNATTPASAAAGEPLPEPAWSFRKTDTALMVLTLIILVPLTGVLARQYLRAADWRNPAHQGRYVAALQARAEKGNPQARYDLAVRYLNGDGFAQDTGKAFYWFKQAAGQQHPNAQYALGICYFQGGGTAQDFVEAAKWFDKAAALGDKHAQHALGYAFEHGFGVEVNLVKAIACYGTAARNGNALSQRALGLIYSARGNYPEAARLFQLAAGQGDAISQDHLGLLYQKGLGVPADAGKAGEWFKAAARQGLPQGQYDLGTWYFNRKDFTNAGLFWRQAATQGLVDAQYALGGLYENSPGGPPDYSQAAGWYLKAAEQGNAPAQMRLGDFYLQGQGVAKDVIRAYQWLKLAQLQGDGEAAQRMKTCVSAMTEEQTAAGEELVKNFCAQAPPADNPAVDIAR